MSNNAGLVYIPESCTIGVIHIMARWSKSCL